METDDTADETTADGETRKDRWLRDFFENSELYTFGIITQKGYKDLEDRLTGHANEVRNRFHRWFVVGLIAYSIIAITTAVAIAGFGLLLVKEKNTSAEIQKQRRDFVRGTCRDQNKRNDQTSRKLNKAMKVAIKQHPERKVEIRQSSEVSLGLINALVPKQN